MSNEEQAGEEPAKTAKAEKRRTRPIAWVGVALILVILGTLVARDPSGARVFAECMVLGKGRFVGELPEGEFKADYFGHTFTGTLDNRLDLSVFVMGAWEREMLTAMEDLLEVTDPDGGVFVDIGANVGSHSIYMSDHATTVHAIEPWPTVLDRMDVMLKENDIDNVVVHPVGFSEEEGSLPYLIPPKGNLGMGTFSKSIIEDNSFGKESIDLPLVVADTYLEKKAVDHIDLVKIDIEGYEKGALLGMAETMKRDRPVVFMELNVLNEEGFHSEEDLRSVFPPDYAFFELTAPTRYMWWVGDRGVVACSNHAGRYTLKPFDMDFSIGHRNLVAMPTDVAKRLDELPDRATVQ